MADSPLAGRVAIVTGGAGALGGAVTARLLADGARVAVPLELAEHGGALRERIRAADRDRLSMDVVDVSDLAAMTRFADTAARRDGRVDILVALVGGFAGGALVETDLATWDRMLTTNLTATFVATRAVVPHMVAAGRGRIVTIGSRSVVPPGSGFIAYTTAKNGVIAFTQALARELQPSGITANSVLPSTMDTPANRAAMPDSDRKGWVSVEAVAGVIAFLASDAAAHLSGALLPV